MTRSRPSILFFACSASSCLYSPDLPADATGELSTNDPSIGTTGTPTTNPKMEPTTDDPTSTTNPTTTTNPTNPTTTDPETTTTTTMTSSTTEDSSSSSESSTDEPSDLPCEAYCELYATACKDFSDYANTQDCLSQCAQWPIGIANETAGDSLGCRTYHVTVASQQEPGIHCPHASPNGDMTCVSPDAPTCGDYCMTYFNNCTDRLNLYKDMGHCMSQCAEWYPGKDGDPGGDSIGCREFHAGVALGDPYTHCPHAGPGGADVCVVPE